MHSRQCVILNQINSRNLFNNCTLTTKIPFWEFDKLFVRSKIILASSGNICVSRLIFLYCTLVWRNGHWAYWVPKGQNPGFGYRQYHGEMGWRQVEQGFSSFFANFLPWFFKVERTIRLRAVECGTLKNHQNMVKSWQKLKKSLVFLWLQVSDTRVSGTWSITTYCRQSLQLYSYFVVALNSKKYCIIYM